MDQANHNPYEPTNFHDENGTTRKRFRFPWGTLIAVCCILGLLVLFLLPFSRRGAGPSVHRTQCRNNLKQIAIGLHNYESNFGSLPPAYTVDDNGRPLHSWRTLLLPYLEHQTLYDSIDLTKPWDDPVNADAYKRAPNIYRCPSSGTTNNLTTYLVIASPDGLFHESKPRSLSGLTRRLNEMLIVIEVSEDEAVHWMSPYDTDDEFVMGFDKDTDFAHRSGTNAVFAEGSVLFIDSDTPEEERKNPF